MEAGIVDALRAGCPDIVSLVADDSGRVVGHVFFSPATVEAGPDGMVLAPLAVLPECQRRGIGTALLERGIGAPRERGCPFVLVYSHPGYYPRFGFEPASARGLSSHLPDVPDDVFMVLVLDGAVMANARGTARHRREFDVAEALEAMGDTPTNESESRERGPGATRRTTGSRSETARTRPRVRRATNKAFERFIGSGTYLP